MMKAAYLLSLALVLTVASTSFGEETVKIGVIAPLTLVNADRGEEMTRTADVFKQQLSARNLKHQYEFPIEDGRCGVGNSATLAAQKFLHQDGIRFLIAGCSGETIQAATLAERARAVTIGVLASDPAIRDLGDYTFRTYVDIEQGIAEISGYMRTHGHRRVALLSEDVPFNQKIDGMLKKNLENSIVFADFFPANSNEFAALLSKINTLNADALYFNTAGPATAANLVNQARRQGLTQPVFTYFMPSEKSFRDTTGSNAEGIVYVDVPDVESASAEYREFTDLYNQRYPDGPKVEFLRRSTYDALSALIKAVEAVGADAAAVKDLLYRLQFDGALGRVAFDRAGDMIGLRFVLRKITNGRPANF